MASPEFFQNGGPFRLIDLADHVGGEVRGNGDVELSDVAPLDQAIEGNISFFDNPKYREQLETTQASACILRPQSVAHAPRDCNLLISNEPYKAYALIAQKFYPRPPLKASISKQANVDPKAIIGRGSEISPGAFIGANVEIGRRTFIGPNAVIMDGVKIGHDCRIGANATLSHCLIGDAVTIYRGVAIGADGFGFAPDLNGHVRVPQLGRVIIQDGCEIGANTTIDRGSGPDTIIGQGTWIDNLVQIGHNVQIGRGVIIAAQVGIAGSSKIEDFVLLGGQAGIAGHITIGAGSQMGAQSGTFRDVPPGQRMGGTPAVPIRDWHRQAKTLAKLAKPGKSKD